MIAGDPDTIAERVQALADVGIEGMTASRCRTSTTWSRSSSRARLGIGVRGAGRLVGVSGIRRATSAALAELVVGFGANVQPDQIVTVSSEPGRRSRPSSRGRGVRPRRQVRRPRGVRSLRQTLAAEARSARDAVLRPALVRRARAGARRGPRRQDRPQSDPSAPSLMADIDPDRLGLDMLPRLREEGEIVAKQLLNWSIVPSPTPGWATIVLPDLDPRGGARAPVGGGRRTSAGSTSRIRCGVEDAARAARARSRRS